MPTLLLNNAGPKRGFEAFAKHTMDGERGCVHCRALGLRDRATFLLETEASPTLGCFIRLRLANSLVVLEATTTCEYIQQSTFFDHDATSKEGSISRRIHLWRPWSLFRRRLNRLWLSRAAPLVHLDVACFTGVVHLAVAASDDGQAYEYHPGDENVDAILLSHAEHLDQGAMLTTEVLPATFHRFCNCLPLLLNSNERIFRP